MPDTGAPWNIPYVEPSDLVRNYPAAAEDLADAIAAGLTAAGQLVAVKSVIKTDTQTSSSVAGGANVAISGLSITHTAANPTNRVILMGMCGVNGSNGSFSGVGLAFALDGVLTDVGDASLTRTRVASGIANGEQAESDGIGALGVPQHISTIVTPGAGEVVYTLRAINIRQSDSTLFINRGPVDSDRLASTRGVSSLILMEVVV